MALVLENITVLDITRIGPGPHCTMLLADFGAQVIKIEPPPTSTAKRLTASAFPRITGISAQKEEENAERQTAYNAINRNKKSLAIDLKSKEGCEIFYKLVKTADVIVEGFRPGVAKRLRIDYNTIKDINRKIVYCSISGYGQNGPYQNLVGHDINYIGVGGALGMIGERNGPPIIPMNLLADFGGGSLQATIGILLALIAQEKTGEGQFIDVAMSDGVISLLATTVSTYFFRGDIPKRGETMLNGDVPWYNVYQTKDGKYICIGCLEPWFWENLCRDLGREDLIPCQNAQGEKKEEIFAVLRQIFLTKTRDEWFNELKEKDICIAPIHALDEVFTDPQVLHRQMVLEVDHPLLKPVRQIGIVPKLSRTPGEVRNFAPFLGQHTEEILSHLGYNSNDIARLHDARVIA